MSTSVWGPRAARIELVTEHASTPLARKERGLHTLDSPLPPGVRYGFRVDGQGPFPDPRSDFLPEGVHGRSVRWDHSADSFDHTDFVQRPLSEAIFYELHVGTFSEEGTFVAAIEHLDHLVELGVTHIELMPVSAFPGERGWGYDGVAPFAPHAPYGSPAELKLLVDEAHKRGLAMVLDVVFNHLGPDGNYLGLYAPYFTDRYRTPWGEAVNLDGPDSDLVRQTFIDAALHWLEVYRFDALRLDAVHALYDQSATHFLEELVRQVTALGERTGRTLLLVAECDLNDPRYLRAPSAGGMGLHAQWCDEFHHALHAVLTGERDGYYEDFGSLELLAKALRQGYVYDGTWSPHRRRFHGRPPESIAPHQLLVFAQNHDQVGNRAHGERLSHLVDRPQLFQAAALTLLSPFVPMLFQGEEWGSERPFLYFTDHVDRQLGKNVTEGRRREFAHFAEFADSSSSEREVPDPQARSTFEASLLDWEAASRREQQELLSWHRQLIRLRAEYQLGSHETGVELHFDEEARWLSMRRGQLLLCVNFSEERRRLPADITEGVRTLASFPGVVSAEELAREGLVARGTWVGKLTPAAAVHSAREE